MLPSSRSRLSHYSRIFAMSGGHRSPRFDNFRRSRRICTNGSALQGPLGIDILNTLSIQAIQQVDKNESGSLRQVLSQIAFRRRNRSLLPPMPGQYFFALPDTRDWRRSDERVYEDIERYRGRYGDRY